jgi:hypothetical protein
MDIDSKCFLMQTACIRDLVASWEFAHPRAYPMASRAASGPSLPQARSRAPISEYNRMKVECQRILNGYAQASPGAAADRCVLYQDRSISWHFSAACGVVENCSWHSQAIALMDSRVALSWKSLVFRRIRSFTDLFPDCWVCCRTSSRHVFALLAANTSSEEMTGRRSMAGRRHGS